MTGTAENVEKSKLDKYSLVFFEIFGAVACQDVSARVGNGDNGDRDRIGCVCKDGRFSLVVAMLRADWYRIPP